MAFVSLASSWRLQLCVSMKLANVHSARVSVFLKYTMFNCLCFYITYDSPLVENKIWFHWNQTHLCCVLQSEVQGSPVCRGFCVQSCSPSRSKVSHTFTFNKSLLVLLLPRVTMHCLLILRAWPSGFPLTCWSRRTGIGETISRGDLSLASTPTGSGLTWTSRASELWGEFFVTDTIWKYGSNVKYEMTCATWHRC